MGEIPCPDYEGDCITKDEGIDQNCTLNLMMNEIYQEIVDDLVQHCTYKYSTFWQAEPEDIRAKTVDLYKYQWNYNLQIYDKKLNYIQNLESVITDVKTRLDNILHHKWTSIDKQYTNFDKQIIVFDEESKTLLNASIELDKKLDTIREKSNNLVDKWKKVCDNIYDKHLLYFEKILSSFSILFNQIISIQQQTTQLLQSAYDAYSDILVAMNQVGQSTTASLGGLGAIAGAIRKLGKRKEDEFLMS